MYVLGYNKRVVGARDRDDLVIVRKREDSTQSYTVVITDEIPQGESIGTVTASFDGCSGSAAVNGDFDSRAISLDVTGTGTVELTVDTVNSPKQTLIFEVLFEA